MLPSVINWPKKLSKMYGNITVGWQTSHLSLENHFSFKGYSVKRPKQLGPEILCFSHPPAFNPYILTGGYF